MPEMDMSNARHPEQLEKMRRHKESGTCHFCPDGFKEHTAPIIFENGCWFITANDYPYDGAIHHYFIVSKTHITDITDVRAIYHLELFHAVKWLRKHLQVKAYSLFVRSGEMKYTGGSLDHVHFHFLVGGPKPENATLADAVPVVIAYKKK